eukprot:6172459-Pleurochrysis_carterae.AAC.1
MLNAPGERELRPRLTPTRARESMRDLSTVGFGSTANALQPKGMGTRAWDSEDSRALATRYAALIGLDADSFGGK